MEKWGDIGAGFNGDIHAAYCSVRVVLIVEEVSDIFWEFGLINVPGKRMQYFGIPLGYNKSSH
jgi:hypothetical protein